MKMHKRLHFYSICAFLCISFSLNAQTPSLQAALCEMACWESSDRDVRDSLLMKKAEYQDTTGEHARAYETLCRIPSFGLTPEQRSELLRRKLLATYRAGMIDEFTALLGETEIQLPSGKPRHKSEDLAMILSIIPGAGFAYAGDWSAAGRDFLVNGAILALGAGALLSGLQAAAFLGGGMLLYSTLPKSADRSVAAAAKRNNDFLKEYYKR